MFKKKTIYNFLITNYINYNSTEIVYSMQTCSTLLLSKVNINTLK